jgi:hypothetical protein
MRFALVVAASGLGAMMLGSSPLDCQEANVPHAFYVVAEYDPTRDPFAELDSAVARARAEGKRILLEVRGERLAESFLIVKVNYGRENRNEEFLSRYPDIHGYPHVFVLQRDGALLHSQNTAELEQGSGYSEKAVLAFLAKWAP